MKKLIVRMTILGITVLLVQLLISWLWLMPAMERDFPQLVLLKKYIAQEREVIIFGDSTDDFSPAGEPDRRSIAKMVGDNLAPFRVGAISHSAYHADLYKEFCRFLVTQDRVPSVVVIPVNLRSFAPNWHHRPTFQFGREQAILRRDLRAWFYHPLAVFKFNFNRISDAQYMRTPVYLGKTQVGVIRDYHIRRKREFASKKEWREYADHAIRDVLLVHYMYELSPHHPKLKSLQEIVDLLVKRQIKPIFYITPIDYQTGERFYPNFFSRRLILNTQSVKKALNKLNTTILDCSRDLKADHFAWRRPVVNEHLTWLGRQHVANKISNTVKCFLK